MDMNRIISAANAIVGGPNLQDRLDRALTELVTLQGTAAHEVEDAIGPLIQDGRQALDSGDHDAQRDVAWQIVRYRDEAERNGVR